MEKEGCPVRIIPNRGEAIRQAVLDCAGPTVLLLTGKGRETRQKRGTAYIDTPTDVEYAQAFLQEYDLRRGLERESPARALLSILPALEARREELWVVCCPPGGEEAAARDAAALSRAGVRMVLVRRGSGPLPAALSGNGVTLSAGDGGLLYRADTGFTVRPKVLDTLLDGGFLPVLEGGEEESLAVAQATRAHQMCIRDSARGAALYGVLTGDGGGAGLTELARLIRDEGISRFAVGTVEEAQALREAGFEDEEILMLRATVDREELERLVDLNVVCTISSVDTGLALNAVAENRSTVAEAHIQVDTGMGFGGFLVGEPEKILLAYRSLPNVALSGIYTQLHACLLYTSAARLLHRAGLAPLQSQGGPQRGVRRPAHHLYPGDGGNGRQGLPPKAQGADGLQVVLGAQLAGSMAEEGRPELVRRDPLPVIGHPQEGEAAVGDLHRHAGRSGVDGVLHQLLGHGGGPLHHLSGGDQIGHMGV